MSEMERQSFEDAIKGLSGEEMKTALKYFETDMLWEELRRREIESRVALEGVKELVKKWSM